MATGAVAAFIAILALGFVEGLRRFYPSKPTWLRLRRARGRLAVRLMRDRFEAGADRRTTRWLAEVLLALVIVWVAAASLLDKRWYEVVLDALPYVIVAVALLRTPGALARVAERMREYERDEGEDPDKPWQEWGDDVIAL